MIFGKKFAANLRKLSPILTVIAVILCVCMSFSTFLNHRLQRIDTKNDANFMFKFSEGLQNFF